MTDPQPAGRVVVFAPHPDDDVIACGGSIVRAVGDGVRVELVYCTDGSMSHAAVLGISSDPSPPELAAIRHDEAVAAAQIMGVGPGDLHFLGFQDTRLADSMNEFRASVLRLLAARDDITEIYLPHEVRELNADHRLTGEGVAHCVATLGLAARLRRYVVWDEQTEDEFAFVNRQPAGRPTDTDERLVTVDISAHLPVKLAALAQHRTQVSLFSPAQTRPVVPESFVRRKVARPFEQFWASDDRKTVAADEPRGVSS
jgi:LmbE family N-acetylglucosaminyl deacetylase